jgi:heptosyltransferase-2
MPGIYDYFLNRKFTGPLLGTLFNTALSLRDIYFSLKSSIGMVIFPIRRNFNIDTSRIRKIIIIKTERVGDIVVGTPSLHALRKAFPNAQIDFLVPRQYATLLNCYSGWDSIVTVNNVIDNNEIKLVGLSLQKSNYDIAIVQHRAKYAYKLGYYSKAPVRIGWNSKGYGYLLTHPLHDDRGTTNHHQVINNIRLLEPLGIKNITPEYPVQITEAGKEQVSAFFKANSIYSTKPILVVHPASYSPRKQWYPDRFAAIIDKAIDSGIQTILIGNGKDLSVVNAVLSFTKNSPFNAYNVFNLEGLVALMNASTIFLGNSTGPMHIAASVNIGTIAIFGDRYKMDRIELWKPYCENGIAVLTECKKNPCIAWSCPKMICFDNITTEMVWVTITNLLSRLRPDFSSQ